MTGGIRPATQVELLFSHVIDILEENMPLKMAKWSQCLLCITFPQNMWHQYQQATPLLTWFILKKQFAGLCTLESAVHSEHLYCLNHNRMECVC